jgi:hypothetical protein
LGKGYKLYLLLLGRGFPALEKAFVEAADNQVQFVYFFFATVGTARVRVLRGQFGFGLVQAYAGI